MAFSNECQSDAVRLLTTGGALVAMATKSHWVKRLSETLAAGKGWRIAVEIRRRTTPASHRPWPVVGNDGEFKQDHGPSESPNRNAQAA